MSKRTHMLVLIGLFVAATAAPWVALRAMQPAPANALPTVVAGTSAAVPSVSQAEATRPGVPPAPVPPSETLGWMFTAGVVANFLMKRLKESAWFPMFNQGAGRANVALAGLLSMVASLGIHTEFDKAAGTLLVTGLTVAGMLHFGGEWLRQWALQQWVWQTSKT